MFCVSPSNVSEEEESASSIDDSDSIFSNFVSAISSAEVIKSAGALCVAVIESLIDC